MGIFEIYQIDDAINAFLASHIDEETGELTSVEELDQLTMERESLIENLCCEYKNVTAEAKAIQTEKLALANRQAMAEKKADSLKRAIEYATGGEKFKTAKAVVGYTTRDVVVIDDVDAVDARYINYEPKISKERIKDAFKNGVSVVGAHIEKHKSINIK